MMVSSFLIEYCLMHLFVDGPPAKQAKKGSGKAPSSASKTGGRPAKKTKTN